MRPNPAEKEAMLAALDRVITIVGDDPNTWTQQLALNRARALIEAIEPQRRCAECLFAQPADWHCLHWQGEIPPDWRKQGCDHWEQDIPF